MRPWSVLCKGQDAEGGVGHYRSLGWGIAHGGGQENEAGWHLDCLVLGLLGPGRSLHFILKALEPFGELPVQVVLLT